MDFQELINNFLDSNLFQEGMAILQTAVMVIVTYLLNKAKAKIAEVKSKSNDLVATFNTKVDDLKDRLEVSDKQLEETKNVLEDQSKKLEQSNKDNKILLQIIALFTLDSKSIAANTKLAISKLLGQLQDQEQVKEVESIIEESKEEEALTLEQVEEIKHESEVAVEESNKNVESITQQTLEIFNEINK